MSLPAAVGSGVAGACALTLLHQAARRAVPHAPRMDVLGERAVESGFRAAGAEPPPQDRLHDLALAGDLVSNSMYYSLVGVAGRESAVVAGAVLGLAAGVGAVTLPGPLGLGSRPSARTPQTAAMTVAWYLFGGLAAGLAYHLLARDNG